MDLLDNKIVQFARLLSKAKRICVFTGAGISVPSGIPDFRSSNGIYSEKYRKTLTPEYILSHSFFLENPEVFFDFYREKMIYPEAKPNPAHLFFAKLENEGKQISVVTQNIDGLHSRAGSKNVIELHGSIHRNYCCNCGRFYSGYDCIFSTCSIPKCSCGGVIKPDVVLYEESLDNTVINNAIDAISEADLMIVIGSSLTVYPAASFIRYFRGENLVLINKSGTEYDENADLLINADIVDVIQKIVI